MSTENRSTTRGGKGNRLATTSTTTKTKYKLQTDSKSDTPKSLDNNPKRKPTAEQMRIAQIIETKFEDTIIRDKIKQIMDATRKSEDEVCTALHDCDFDLDRTVTMLLEGNTNEWETWETSSKKKKNRQTNTTKTETVHNNRSSDQEDWNQERDTNQENDRSRNRGGSGGGGPPRLRGRGSLDTRRWRGRENKENEKNLEESREPFHRGGRMMHGPGRGGRGGRGGRMGPRTFQNRDKGGFPRSIETWNNPSADDSSGEKMEKWGDDFPPAEDWDSEENSPSVVTKKWGDDFPSPEDWDNEEYTGSLADSKVFTPSGATHVTATPLDPTEPTIPTSEPSSLPANNSSNLIATSIKLEDHQPTSQLSQTSQNSVPVVSNSLNSVQTEYLKLTQAAESVKSSIICTTSTLAVTTSTATYGPPSSSTFNTSTSAYLPSSPPSGFTSAPVSFTSSSFAGSSSSNYTNQMQEQSRDSTGTTVQSQTLPARTKTQRPRVPPPSKIPATAVEMPGDAINSIGYLDVQFGGLEFGSESSFDTSTEQSKYTSNVTSGSVLDSIPSPRTSANLDLSGSNQQTPALDAYSTTQKATQSNLPSALSDTRKMTGADSILPSSDLKVNQQTYSTDAGLELDKNDISLSYSAATTVAYQPSYQSQKSASVYQTPSSYTSSNYSSTQVTSSTAAYPNQTQVSYTSSGTGSSYSNQTAVSSSYPSNSYSQTSSGVTYQAGPASYPSITQSSNSFPSATPSYQSTGQSAYGVTMLGNTAYAGTAGTAQYQNNYGGNAVTTTQNHSKISGSLSAGTKDNQYDATTATSTSLSNTNSTTTNSSLSTTMNATPNLALVTSSPTVNTTKVTSSSGKSSIVPSIPPGVPPMLGTQYIMSQGGLPYFQQPVYSYEELQLLQQRIPHVTGYYDMGFPAPTSLATGREASLSSGLAYTMSDGRFTRADNNASPVPSTLSQQNATQAHQQPMLNPTALPPAYAYFYGAGMMPGSFQYGTPALYPMPPATNAHANTSSTQYPKPGSYASAYGSGYDGLSQNQDYSKTGYVTATQSQTKSGVGANAGTTGSSATDLSATMYGKSHVALGKVNSYEKQGFHSGTPPPFNIPGTQSTPIAPTGAYTPHVFIPTMPPHQQHHSTLLHQPLHQDTASGGAQRSQTSAQPNKSGAKQGYSASYWAGN